jgi:hypothetical protein
MRDIMPSEALRNIKTMRQVRSSLDIVRRQRIRTTNSLSKSEDEASPLLNLSDPKVKQTLEKEAKRFAAREESFNRSRRRILAAREKLAVTINVNRALTQRRLELQQARLEGKNPIPEKAPEQAIVKAPSKITTRKPGKQKMRKVAIKY